MSLAKFMKYAFIFGFLGSVLLVTRKVLNLVIRDFKVFCNIRIPHKPFRIFTRIDSMESEEQNTLFYLILSVSVVFRKLHEILKKIRRP